MWAISLFSLFYYLYLGMWKRAITYMVGVIVLERILVMIGLDSGAADSLTPFVVGAVYGTRANIDYYRKIRQGNNGWY